MPEREKIGRIEFRVSASRSGWHVLISLPGNREFDRRSFKTRAGAKAWIGCYAQDWAKRFQGR